MPKNNNSQTNPNPISQIFMNKANEQFSKIKKLNFSPTPSIDDIKKLKAMSEYAEKYFKYALFTGCDNAAYELIQLYDFIFTKYPDSQNNDLQKKIFRNDLVLLGPKFEIAECQQMNLIFNPPTTNESEINIFYDAICRTREYFSNKKLVDNPETNDEIINYYLKSFKAISEKQYFNSIKEITGTVLNCADKKTLDFIINDRKPKIKPTITFYKNNKLHEIYCDAEKDISITIVYDTQNNNEEVNLSGYPNLLEIINHFFSI